MFEVSIKTLDGVSRTFNIEDEDMTVRAFREMIVREMDIPIDRQRLIFQGKVLVDERKLKDCGVDSKTIHLVPRPPPQVTQDTYSSASTSEAPRQRSANTPFGSSSIDIQNLLDVNNNPPVISAINEQFNQFITDAKQILDEMERGDAPAQSSSTASASTTEAPAETPSTSTATASTSSNIVNFGRLADVLAEYRQIESRMQPFLDRYHSMLQAEQTRRNAARAAASPASSTAEPMDTSERPADEPWSDDFFEQMSRLFHVNSHLLHLLSEFFVATNQTRGGSRATSFRRSVTTRSMSAQRPPLAQQQSTAAAAARTRVGASATASPVRQSPRALVIAHPNTSVVYAHINIEPYVFSVARPPSLQQESATTTNDATATTTASSSPEGTPATAESGAEDEAASTRRRSRSANPPGLGSLLPDLLGVGMYNLDLGDALFSGGERSATSSTESSATPTAAAATSTTAAEASTTTTPGESAAVTTSTEQTRGASATRPTTTRFRSTASSGSTQTRLPIPFNEFLADLQRSRDRFLPCSSRHMNPRQGGHSGSGGIVLEEGGSSVGGGGGGSESTRRPGYIVRLPRARRAVTPGAETRRGSSSTSTTAVPTSGPGVSGSAPPASASATPLPPFIGGLGQGVIPPPAQLPNDMMVSMLNAALELGRRVEVGRGSTGTPMPTPVSSSSGGGGGGGGGGATPVGPTTTAAAATSAFSATTSVAIDALTRLLGGVAPNMNLATSGPFTLVVEDSARGFLNSRLGESRSATSSSAAAPREPGPMNMLPGMVVDSLLRSVWSSIFDLARLRLPDTDFPPARATDWARGAEAESNTTYQPRVSLAPLNAVMRTLAVRLSEVAAVHYEASSADATLPPTPLLLHALNRVYRPAESLAQENLITSSDCGLEVAPRLLALLLNAWDTDEAVGYPSGEAEALAWSTSPACARLSGGGPTVDVRRSLYNFLRVSLARHMEQWRSPGPEQEEAPGRMLLNTMRAWMLEALVFCNLLQHQAAARLGLTRDDADTDLVSTTPLSNLVADLQRFARSLPADSNARMAYELLSRGLSSLSADLEREGSRLLAENRERYTAYVATRDSLIDLSPEAAGAQCSTEAPSKASTSEPLPDLQTNFQAPASTAEALAPHPDAPQRENGAPALPSPPPGDLPSSWAEVVARDVAQMRSQASSGVNESSGLRRRIEAAAEEEDPCAADEQAVSRLSDAYIAGMPVKRRRVMLERKQSLACPMDELFMNLLNEAMSQPAATISPDTGSASSSSTASPAEATSAALPPPPPPPPRSVAEAFRAHVRDHLARRLASDPDFDARRHPAASEVFAKRRGGGRGGK